VSQVAEIQTIWAQGAGGAVFQIDVTENVEHLLSVGILTEVPSPAPAKKSPPPRRAAEAAE